MYGATVKREWNKYRFDDIKIGMIEQFNCVISENMQRDRFKLDPLTNSLFQFLFLHIFKNVIKGW